jgi:hypothetical protein
MGARPLACLLALVTALFTLPVPGYTTPTSSSPTDIYNGNEYAVSVLSHIGNTYQIEFDIYIRDTYTGNRWMDTIRTVEIKDFVGSYTNASLVSAPDGPEQWRLSNNELTSKGATGGSNLNRLVAEAAMPYEGAEVTGPNEVLSWVLQFDSADVLNDTVHIKYLYWDQAKDKKAKGTDLGSWDIEVQRESVSEPATLLLLGLGFAGVAGIRRRLTK